ncbi:hypothetical protein RB2501_12297 [Robiginitalea biformata HTCC2501]|uniref:Uncharacterized protein n=1 Tax=Robiginitalea biformata (strain ATCC BAA-864 / DSM 15991 / KCTC 12146 / HTCC2501) TaxID=313596 RepID=A4CN66_ROBBH|nr:hypothetical protein RB2501_12297 [Robiginitalea biformata HTCC2501]
MLCLTGCGDDTAPELTQKVLIYEKSNWDGSNKGQIAVYFEEATKLESFKWHKGNNQATIVRAWMDSSSHTVRRFEALRVDATGNENLSAVLETQPGGSMDIRLGDHRQEFQNAPSQWHSYDFDFASLGYAFRFLRQGTDPIVFHILDLDLSESPPVLRDFGNVEMTFQGEENLKGRKLLAYRIDGIGLDNRGGTIRFDKEEGYLHSFEIQKPDEPGYDSGKLVLQSVTSMNKAEWRNFKYRQLHADTVSH